MFSTSPVPQMPRPVCGAHFAGSGAVPAAPLNSSKKVSGFGGVTGVTGVTGTGTVCVWLPSGLKTAGPVCSVTGTPRVSSLLVVTVPSVTRAIRRACRRVDSPALPSARVVFGRPCGPQEVALEDRQRPGALDLQAVPLVLVPVVQRVLDEDDRELGGRPYRQTPLRE